MEYELKTAQFSQFKFVKQVKPHWSDKDVFEFCQNYNFESTKIAEALDKSYAINFESAKNAVALDKKVEVTDITEEERKYEIINKSDIPIQNIIATSNPITKSIEVIKFDPLDEEVGCPYSNCTWLGKFKDLSTHKSTCPAYSLNCELCDVKIARSKIDSHKKECPERKIECNECKIALIAKNM
jgi:hypothetical protein